MDLRYSVFFSKANNGYAKHTFESVFGALMYFGIIVLLMFFPVAGIAISVFLMGYLCLCYKGFYINLLKGEKVGLEDFFVNLKYSVKAFILKFSTTLISVLWGLLLIVPGVICAINYSMAFYILADDKTKDSLKCMEESKSLVNGARGEVFLIYLAEFFTITVIACIFTALTLALKYIVSLPLWLTISLPIALSLFVLIVLIIPYFEMMLSNLYLMLKEHKQTPKQKQTPNKTVPKKTTKKAEDIIQ